MRARQLARNERVSVNPAMLNSVLIANRGEIACRIARTAKSLGLRTIAVYSDADANASHVRLCDEAHWIGPSPARESYLSVEKLIAVASKARADCVHPGYGFLSENAEFAEACAAAGLVFVGPPPAAIRAMGLKDQAKSLMEKAGVPVVPGYHGDRQDPKFLKEKAYEIGYPVLIKPAAGGGGRGMRRVDRHADFEVALEGASRESQSAFGSSRVLIEKYIVAPRHIEFQVFGDTHGNIIHLGERDCSLQRRHQKVIEEAPAPGMTPELRERIGAVAVAAARAVNYAGAGTVEFVASGSDGLKPEAIFFIEMNTRLQVEHPVTEAITGLDLVEWQFRVAAGEKLPLAQSAVRFDGHAVEARLYAEDPERDFLPSTGPLLALRLPNDIRVDRGVEEGGQVSPYYDAMIAKLIAHAPTREAALDKLSRALDRTVVAGVRTNAGFLARLVRAEGFRHGAFDIGFIDRNLAMLAAVPQETDAAAAASGAAALLGAAMADGDAEAAGIGSPFNSPISSPISSPWAARDGFQLGGLRKTTLPIEVDGRPETAEVIYRRSGVEVGVQGKQPAADAAVFLDDGEAYVVRQGRQTRVRPRVFVGGAAAAGDSDGVIRAPMHGRVLEVLVSESEAVAAGQRLAVIEAMKMEHTLRAPFQGRVQRIAVAAGAQVVEGAQVMVIQPAATA
jgi:3-methylcrotonyl-CoA carboxylase alpha subunit